MLIWQRLALLRDTVCHFVAVIVLHWVTEVIQNGCGCVLHMFWKVLLWPSVVGWFLSTRSTTTITVMGTLWVYLLQLLHLSEYGTYFFPPYTSQKFDMYSPILDRLCGLVVRVSGYRYRGLGFDSRRYQIFWVVMGLERGPFILVRSIEELRE